MKIDRIDFNEEWAKKNSKADFLKVHEHHALDTDLSAAYTELTKKPEKAAKVEETEKAK